MSGMNFQTLSSFHNPLQAYTYNPGKGLYLPREIRDPFLAQPGMSPIMSAFMSDQGIRTTSDFDPHTVRVTDAGKNVLFDPLEARYVSDSGRTVSRESLKHSDDDPYATWVTDAMGKVSSDPDAAGEEFKRIRINMETNDRGVGGALYGMASFGEAIWGQVDEGTFAALRNVRLAADEEKDETTLARELLIRSVASAKVGNDEAALNTLRFAVDSEEMKSSVPLQITSMVMYANVLVNQGFKYTGAKRNEALEYLGELMNETIPETIREAKDDSYVAETMESTLPDLYVYIADYFLAQHRPLDAMNIINTLKEYYPEHPKTLALFENPSPVTGDGPSTKVRTPLQNLIASQTRDPEESDQSFNHIIAGAAEFLRTSSFENNVAYWKSALCGAIPASIAGAVYGFFSNGSFSAALMGAGLGATLSVAASKIKRGATSEETRQAFITGYSDTNLGQVAFSETMKLLATYAFFGGALPLLNFMPDFTLAASGNFTGQLYGPGSVLSYFVSSATERMNQLVTSISDTNFTDGFMNFWDGWRATSPFAQALHNGLTLPFRPSTDIVEMLFQRYSTWDKAVEFYKTLPSDGLAGAAISAASAALASYVGASGLYAIFSMNPTLAAFMKDKLPKNIDRKLFLGAYLGTVAGMVASGFNPLSASIFTLFCYAVQYRHHVQSGGDWRIYKKDVFRGLDLSKFMRAGAIQLLYIGPGNAIKPNIPKIDWMASTFPEITNYLLANVEAHMGMVPFLAALGVFHAAFTGLNIRQTLLAKYAKAYTYEIPANVLKLSLGWTSLAGNVAGTAIKEFGIGASVTASFREAGNSPIQLDAVMGNLKKIGLERKNLEAAVPEGLASPFVKLYERMAAEALETERQGTLAARSGDGARFLKDNYAMLPFQEKLIKLTSNYYVRSDRSPFIPPRPASSEYNDVVFRALVTTETPGEVVDEYLSRLRIILTDLDPALADVRHNLLVATICAVAGAAHGDRIKGFLDSEDVWLVMQSYGLIALYEKVAEKRGTYDSEAWKALRILPGSSRGFIAKHFRKPVLSQEDKFYNAATVPGRSFPFSGVVTGNSVVQNGSPLFAFLLSAIQGDPAFETKADPTFFKGTLYKILMGNPAKAEMGMEQYRVEYLLPLLSGVLNSASKLNDSRFDIRHNLLTTIWLASNGPHSELLKKWIEEHKHLYNAHGIYGEPKIGSKVVALPRSRSLKERRLINALFKQYLVNSTNSADGKVRYNMPPKAGPMRWSSLESLK